MTVRSWVFSALVAVAVASFAACSEDGGGGEPTNDPEATATRTTAFDAESLTPEILASAILRPADLGEGFDENIIPSPPQEGTSGINAQYSDGKIRVQSSVVAYDDLLEIEAQFQENRLIFPGNGALESNFDLANTDVAYRYQLFRPDGYATFALASNFMVFVFLQAVDRETPDPRALDEAYFQELANTVGERLKPLLDDPSSVEPVEGIRPGSAATAVATP